MCGWVYAGVRMVVPVEEASSRNQDQDCGVKGQDTQEEQRAVTRQDNTRRR